MPLQGRCAQSWPSSRPVTPPLSGRGNLHGVSSGCGEQEHSQHRNVEDTALSFQVQVPPSPRAGLGSELWHQPLFTGRGQQDLARPVPWAVSTWALQKRPLLWSPGVGSSGCWCVSFQLLLRQITTDSWHKTTHGFPYSSRDGKSKNSPWAKIRCQLDSPSAGSNGDPLSCPFQPLEASQMPWLVSPFFIITPTSAFVLTSPSAL